MALLRHIFTRPQVETPVTFSSSFWCRDSSVAPLLLGWPAPQRSMAALNLQLAASWQPYTNMTNNASSDRSHDPRPDSAHTMNCTSGFNLLSLQHALKPVIWTTNFTLTCSEEPQGHLWENYTFLGTTTAKWEAGFLKTLDSHWNTPPLCRAFMQNWHCFMMPTIRNGIDKRWMCACLCSMRPYYFSVSH